MSIGLTTVTGEKDVDIKGKQRREGKTGMLGYLTFWMAIGLS